MSSVMFMVWKLISVCSSTCYTFIVNLLLYFPLSHYKRYLLLRNFLLFFLFFWMIKVEYMYIWLCYLQVISKLKWKSNNKIPNLVRCAYRVWLELNWLHLLHGWFNDWLNHPSCSRLSHNGSFFYKRLSHASLILKISIFSNRQAYIGRYW